MNPIGKYVIGGIAGFFAFTISGGFEYADRVGYQKNKEYKEQVAKTQEQYRLDAPKRAAEAALQQSKREEYKKLREEELAKQQQARAEQERANQEAAPIILEQYRLNSENRRIEQEANRAALEASRAEIRDRMASEHAQVMMMKNIRGN